MATSVSGEGQPSLNGIISDPQTKRLTDLPTELLEHILCFPVLKHVDICNVSCCCKRLHDVCHGRGKVWGHQYKLRCCVLFVCVFSTESVEMSLAVLFDLSCSDASLAHCLLKARLLRTHSQLSADDILLMHQIHHQARSVAIFLLCAHMHRLQILAFKPLQAAIHSPSFPEWPKMNLV